MKSIGFIDLYISEWHANNYPAWIKEITSDYEVKYIWAEEEISRVDGVTTDEWCEKYGTEKCGSIEELCEKSDAIIILAPSNPEKHLEYAKRVLPFKKPTYIDKPFAESKKAAKEIFDIANKFGTPFFSSSALRYAEELSSKAKCLSVATQGGGSNLPEYIIHQAEMVVKKMGVGAVKIKGEKLCDSQFTFTVGYADGRMAGMHFAVGAAFTVTMTDEKGTECKKIESAFFKFLIKDIIAFFNIKKPSFDINETLEANRLMTGAIKAANKPDKWIKL